MADVVERRAHAFVAGIVQGVWYRKSTWEKATELGLRGWVRNLPDGRVEFVAEGRREDVTALLAWAGNGPPDARVDDLAVVDEQATGTEPLFEVRR